MSEIGRSFKQMLGDHKKTLQPNKGSFNSIVANDVEDNNYLANLKIYLSRFLFISKLTINI